MDRFLCIFEVASASIKSDELHAVQGHSLSATALGYVRFKKQTFSIFGMGFLHARWPSCGSTNSNKEVLKVINTNSKSSVKTRG